MYTLNCKGTLLSLADPLVMGIMNVTPDSFYAGSRMTDTADLLRTVADMVSAGAGMIDIGGMSTRPGAALISVEDEMERLIPAIEVIHRQYPALILSVDSYRAPVVEAALIAGASVINDVSGASDESLLTLSAKYHAPYICMHNRGNAQTMQSLAQYEDVVSSVLTFFVQQVQRCREAGITDIIIDPGFGFAKTPAHNFELIRKLEVFRMLELPLLFGISRKSTVYKTLGTTAEEALNGTTVLNTVGLMRGASILRVHDVKEANETVRLWKVCK